MNELSPRSPWVYCEISEEIVVRIRNEGEGGGAVFLSASCGLQIRYGVWAPKLDRVVFLPVNIHLSTISCVKLVFS